MASMRKIIPSLLYFASVSGLRRLNAPGYLPAGAAPLPRALGMPGGLEDVSRIEQRWTDRLAALYFLFIGFVTLVYGVRNLRIKSDFAMGDWLINYSAGFVRRGLLGQIALMLSHWHVPPLLFVLLCQLAIYAIILTSVWRLYLTSNRVISVWGWLLLISPATLAFPILNPPGGFRKEVLVLALLCLSVHLARAGVSPFAMSCCLSLGVVLLLLCHEGMVFYLIYVFVPLAAKCRTMMTFFKSCILPAGSAVFVFVLVLTHAGNSQMEHIICESVMTNTHSTGSGICGGAIGDLRKSASMEHRLVIAAIEESRYVLLYGITGLLGFLPLIMELRKRLLDAESRHNAIVLGAAIAFSLLLSVPLFYNAIDWGRWLYIHLLSSLILILFLFNNPKPSKKHSLGRGTASFRKKDLFLAVGMLAYATLWTLPYYGQFPARFGYFGLAHYVRSHGIEKSHP
jgi:hypothetical protein